MWDCGNQTLGTNCISRGYDDIYDVMGGFRVTHFNMIHKEKTGWTNERNRIEEVMSSGIYRILPLEVQQSGVKGLKIRKDTTSFYYVEYRRRIGFDSDLYSPYVHINLDGVFIHFNDTYDFQGNTADSQLLDMTPGGYSLTNITTIFDVVLEEGMTFVDFLSGIQINVLDISDIGATVFISVPQCSNTRDDDNDGKCDYQGCYINGVWKPADPDCKSIRDDSEAPNTFNVQDLNGNVVAVFSDDGNIQLLGQCNIRTDCDNSGDGAFVVKNSLGANVAFINVLGNMCIKSGSCTQPSSSCYVGANDFVINDELGTAKIVINENGNLCFTGQLKQKNVATKK